MKRIILLLITSSLFLMCVLSASAAENEIPADAAQQIKETYAEGSDYTAEELSIRGIGQFEGCWVFFMDGPFSFPTEEITEEVAGKTFWYPTYQRLSVYRDGAILKLSDAYAEGWLSADGVAQIWEVYSAGNPKTGDPLGVVLLTMFAAATGCIWVCKRR